MTTKSPSKTQSDKFKDLAREVEADEDEQTFDRALRKMRDAPAGDPTTPSPKER